MYKLIIADIKVLGHKLWMIPLISSLVILSILIARTYVTNQPFGSLSFILTPIITAFLGFQLMRNYDGSKLHIQLASLPCSKIQIVIQKYFMFILFFLLAALIEYLFALFVNIFSPRDNTVFILGTMNATLLGSLRALIMLMPLYFKIKNGRKAFLLLLPWFILPIILSSTLINELLISYSDINKTVFIYTTMLIISIVAMLVFYLKDRKQSSVINLLVFPITVILPISIGMTIEALTRVIFHFITYRMLSENFEYGWYVWNMERYLRFFTVHSIVALIIVGVLMYVLKKGTINKIIYNIYLIILLPVLFFSLGNIIRYFIYAREWFVGKNFIVDHVWSISQYIIFIPMLIVSIYYSKKFLSEGE